MVDFTDSDLMMRKNKPSYPVVPVKNLASKLKFYRSRLLINGKISLKFCEDS